MRQNSTMNVSLTPEIGAFVAGRIASGPFHEVSGVVGAGLLLLAEDEKWRARSGVLACVRADQRG